MIDGMFNLSVWGYVLATLVITHITIVGVTVYLHRHQAHRALELHPIVSHFFRFWLWLTTGMETKAWVAIHRKHHAKVETKDDPHSPQIFGIKKVLWEGAELYKNEAENEQTLKDYGHGTPDDWIERHIYTPYSGRGLLAMLIINLIVFGVPGVTIWAIQMMWIPIFAAGIINGVGHWWGYRNYEVQDASTNIVPWGILIGGEELHNNHHTFASSAKLSSKWWEFDIGWMYIRLFETLGLATVKKVAPEPVIDPAKSTVDMDTLTAIITNRFQVMASYSKHVLDRVRRDEMRKASSSYRKFLKKSRRLLIREETLMDKHAKHKLMSMLNSSHALETVYHYKIRLQGIWRRSAESNENLLQALQEWCKQAEATGIKALEEFAQLIKGYSLQVAHT